MVGKVLAGAQRRGLLTLGDPALETERLAALLDGLALAVVGSPGIAPATAREVLRIHLASLTTRR